MRSIRQTLLLAVLLTCSVAVLCGFESSMLPKTRLIFQYDVGVAVEVESSTSYENQFVDHRIGYYISRRDNLKEE